MVRLSFASLWRVLFLYMLVAVPGGDPRFPCLLLCQGAIPERELLFNFMRFPHLPLWYAPQTQLLLLSLLLLLLLLVVARPHAISGFGLLVSALASATAFVSPLTSRCVDKP